MTDLRVVELRETGDVPVEGMTLAGVLQLAAAAGYTPDELKLDSDSGWHSALLMTAATYDARHGLA